MTVQGGFAVNSPTFKNAGTILLGPSAYLSIGSTVTMADLGDLRDQTVAGQVTVRKLDNRGQTLDLSKLPFRHPKMFFAISGGRIEGPGNYNIGLSDFNLQEAVIGADLTFNERVFWTM